MKKKTGCLILGTLVLAMLVCGCDKKKEIEVSAAVSNQDNAVEDEPVYEGPVDNVIVTTKDGATETIDGILAEKEMSDEAIEKAVADILNDLDNYRIAVLFEHEYNDLSEPESTYVVFFDDAQITQAAGYSKSVKHEEPYELEAGMAAYLIDKESMDEECVNLFGRVPDYSTLEDSSTADEGICLYNNEPLMKYFDLETDTDSNVIESTICVEEDNITATQYVYHGHWSGTQNGESNYEINYIFEKNGDSKYGIVLKKMVLYRQEEMWDGYKTYSMPCMAMPKEGFYGVWVAASKDRVEAENIASSMVGQGLDSIVLLSSEWANLNSEPVYVVTIGYYMNETEAKAALTDVKAAGYKDAYVKYSGERK